MPKKTKRTATQRSRQQTAKVAVPSPRRPAAAKKVPRRGQGGQPGQRGKSIKGDRLRFAVVGQGYFAQSSILPAFGHARESCELVALFSDDQSKRESCGASTRSAFALPYEEYDDFLRSGEVQAVYIALPNHLHCDYTVRAARAGVHVLCEKPMAVTVEECEQMIDACAENRVKLMIAYRLHLEPANLAAIEAIQRGRIGEPRYFTSAFSFRLGEDNVRGMPTEQGWRAALRHRHLLHQRRPLPVPGRTNPGGGADRAPSRPARPGATSRSRSAPSCAFPMTGWPASSSASAPPMLRATRSPAQGVPDPGSRVHPLQRQSR